MKKHFILLVMIISVSFSMQAQWQPLNGPFGGSVYSMTSKGSKLFVGTSNGVYMSTDNGDSWIRRSNGIYNLYISSIASQGNRVFAGSFNLLDMMYSDDEGLSWQKFEWDYNVYAVCSDAQYVYLIDQQGLKRSSDEGNTWTNLAYVNVGWEFINVYTSGNKIFMPAQGGFIRSLDGGVSFEDVNVYPEYHSFAFKGQDIYSAGMGEIHKSTDQGDTWNDVLNVNSITMNTLCTAGNTILAGFYGPYYSASDSVIGGIYRSENNGASWIDCGFSNRQIRFIKYFNNRVFAGFQYGGLIVSDDQGQTWHESDQGLYPLPVTQFDVKGNTIVACVLNEDVCVSNDNGNSWKHTGLPSGPVMMIQNQIFCGKYRSSDQGLSWLEVFTFPFGIASYAALNNRIFASTFGGGIYYTDDFGTTWNTCNNGLTTWDISAVQEIGGKVYAVTKDGLFVFNGSNLWSLRDDEVSAGGITVLGGNQNHLVAAGHSIGNHLFHSTDQGGSWFLTDFDYPQENVPLASETRCFGSSGEKIFQALSYSNYPLFFSDDNGFTWSVASTGLIHDVFITNIRISSGLVYVSCSDNEYGIENSHMGLMVRPLSEFVAFKPVTDTIFLSKDAGSNTVLGITSTTPWIILQSLPGWFSLSNDRGDLTAQITVTAAETNPYDPPRYFTMEITSVGITRTVVIAQSGKLVGVNEKDHPEITICPNPTSGPITVNAAGFEKISISDISGKILFSQQFNMSENKFDLSGINKGIYYLTLTGSKGTIIRKIIRN